MMKTELEKRLAGILAWGGLAVTILVTDRVSTDPVNVGKMVLLSVIAFSVLPVLQMQKRELVASGRVILVACLSLILIASISIFTSANPIERGLYGAFARNTGVVTYASLAIIFLAATLLSRHQSFEKVTKALFFAGLVNTILSLLDAAGFDLFTWTNRYSGVLGTFGNPNFIGAVMGLFFTLLVVQLFDNEVASRLKLLFGTLLPFVALTIFFTRTLQGILLALFGSIAVFFFYLRSIERFARISLVFLYTAAASGFLVFLGILNTGPLATLLYKSSVTFRGEYWKAGINMGLEKPLTGVGLDSYGTYYRTFRELSATISPGLEVSTDSAHNVFIDVFAGTGFPGLIAYLTINIYVLFSAFKYVKETKKFDNQFLSLFLCWATYQLQSIISINQIGLAIWGWLLGGSVIAYSRSHSNGNLNLRKVESKKFIKNLIDEPLDASTSLKLIGGAVVGLLIALPPFVVDAKMRSLFSQKASPESAIALAMSWPVDNIRLNKIIVELSRSNLNEDARELAVFASQEFPSDYASWWVLDLLTREGIPEKEILRRKLHLIDPHNPNYFEK
jgi:O-antigen ligase